MRADSERQRKESLRMAHKVLHPVAADVAREVTDRVQRGAMVSFAQNYEDVMLARCFHDVNDGFYIDVGAFHPTINSVTRHFYERGWTGVNLEPNQDLLKAFNTDRQRDLNLSFALGAATGTATLHLSPARGWSTFDTELAAVYNENDTPLKAQSVDVLTLADMFERFVNRSVDFLKVDVEGFERQVFAGADFTRHRPTVMLAETAAPAILAADRDHRDKVARWADWVDDVVKNGYEVVYNDGLNTFFLSEEASHFREHFKNPPNFFDDFIHYKTVLMAREILRP